MPDPLFVEPFDGSSGTLGFLVGVGSFPIFEVEGGFREEFERVLGLGFFLGDQVVIVVLRFGFLLFGLLLFLRFLGGGSLRLLFLLLRLLGGRGVREGFFWPLDGPELSDLWLIKDSLDEADK